MYHEQQMVMTSRSLLPVLFCLLLALPSGDARAGTGAEESFSQRQIPLIFPGMQYQNTAEAQYQLPPDATPLQLRTADGVKIEAVFWPAAKTDGNPAAMPTIIYFYGNAQCINYALAQAAVLRRCGANVLLGDYPGFGLSAGKPSESGCYAEAEALYEWASRQDGIDHGKLISAGWSLGAAVAIDLAARHDMAGLITFSAYTSKRDMARRQFPDVPPEAIEHPFLSRDKIRHITCPTLLVHGRQDTLVPFTMSTEMREAAAGKPLTYLPIDDAAHNDLFLKGGKQIEAAVRQFLAERAAGPTSRPR
jgi:pimeloyl-ACP methyl ester carboxylesterase